MAWRGAGPGVLAEFSNAPSLDAADDAPMTAGRLWTTASGGRSSGPTSMGRRPAACRVAFATQPDRPLRLRSAHGHRFLRLSRRKAERPDRGSVRGTIADCPGAIPLI